LLLIFRFSFGQNWELFPNGQRSYYTNADITSNLEIAVVDSFNDDGITQHYRFDGSDYFVNGAECFDAIIQAGEEGWIYCETLPGNYFPFIDSIAMVNDTAWIYSDEIPYLPYFLPNAAVGDEWNILPPGYEDIVIRCTSIVEETFFGITDSVKSFRFFYDDGASILEAAEIELSKHYGLTEFVDFNFLGNYDGTGTMTVYTMEGVVNDTIQKGYYLEDYEKYFTYDAGDVLIWEIHYYSVGIFPENYFEYYKDSILSKEVYADSIVFHIDGTKKDSSGALIFYPDKRVVYARSGFDPLLQSPATGISTGNNVYALFGNDDQHEIWCNLATEINLDTDTTTIRTFRGGANYIYTPECYVAQVTDVGSAFTMQNGIGVTEHSWGAGKGSVTWTLIGYSINGNIWGNMNFNGLAIAEGTENKIELFPNPATDILQVVLPVTHSDLYYTVYDASGKILETAQLTDATIDIHHLHPGTYFLEIKNDQTTGRTSFIKL